MIVNGPALKPCTIPESESTEAAAALLDRQCTAVPDPGGSPHVGAFAVNCVLSPTKMETLAGETTTPVSGQSTP